MFSQAYGLMFSAPDSEKKMYPFFLRIITEYRNLGNKIHSPNIFTQIAENGAVFTLMQQEGMLIFHITCPTEEIFQTIRDITSRVITEMKIGTEDSHRATESQSSQS